MLCLATSHPSPPLPNSLLLLPAACLLTDHPSLLPNDPVPEPQVMLHADADPSDVSDVLLLLNQLMARFKAALQPLMQARRGLGQCP